MSGPVDQGAGPRYASRPEGLRTSRPWHRLAYIIEALPLGLKALVDELDGRPDLRILDYGCADQPYRWLFAQDVDYVGADLPGNPLATVEVADDGSLPLPEASFDVLISTQALEHVEDPALYLREAFRVLRSGGRLLLSTHGIMVYHPDPVDLWRWTGAGLRKAVGDAGFTVDRFDGIMGLTATGLQLVQDAVYWRSPRWLRPVVALLAQSLIRIVDRWDGPARRRDNALVFALLASKP